MLIPKLLIYSPWGLRSLLDSIMIHSCECDIKQSNLFLLLNIRTEALWLNIHCQTLRHIASLNVQKSADPENEKNYGF